MLSVEPTRDWELIKSIATNVKVWPHITDDFSGKLEDFEPLKDELALYLLVKDGTEVLGFFMFYPHNKICWEIHTCLLPHAWGERAHSALAVASEWIWTKTDCRRVVTVVPRYNRLALAFALSGGMTQYGVNPRSWMKHGRLHDLICLGIGRPEENKICRS